ncbi:hypothetical protein D3C85_469130 [compost metagenome]
MDYAAWIGKIQVSHDSLNHSHVKRIGWTLGQAAPCDGADLPLLWHWAFFHESVDSQELGVDGHPLTGEFLPETHGRKRMWAGSRLTFHRPLKIGVSALRRSSILSVKEKAGRSGSLLFVTVGHEYLQEDELKLYEEQDIVYKAASGTLTIGEPLPDSDWQQSLPVNPALLFRYSAITFNAHRIHYDLHYVTEVEGYPGLVMHGPLVATLALQSLLEAHPGIAVSRFSFKGVRPLIAGENLIVQGRLNTPGVAELWSGNTQGIGQVGKVSFDVA